MVLLLQKLDKRKICKVMLLRDVWETTYKSKRAQVNILTTADERGLGLFENERKAANALLLEADGP